MSVDKENTVPRETHQQGITYLVDSAICFRLCMCYLTVPVVDEILRTPGVGSKPGLVEANDINGLDIQGIGF